MTCKNCIHEKICWSRMTQGAWELREPRGCEDFSDKTYNIRLQFRVGDLFYTIRNGFPESKMVERIVILPSGEYVVQDNKRNEYAEREMFSTREAAEKALKERKPK